MWTSTVLGQNSLNVADWLGRPNVRLVAVEFYANWCAPCMKAMPRWEALKERYYDQGLRVIVVKVRDPNNPGCATIGFEPDDFVCDDQGHIERSFGFNSLPAAYLWSWQGNLLVQNGHIESIEKAVERYLGSAPRVDIQSAGQGISAGLLAQVKDEVIRSGKLTVVASAEDRAAIRAAKARQNSIQVNQQQACEAGQEVPANALLRVSKVKGQKNFLNLTIVDLESGCVRKATSVPWSRNDRAMATNGVAKLLGTLKRGGIQMPRAGGTTAAPAVTPKAAPTQETWSAGSGGGGVNIIAFRSTPPGATVEVDGEPLCTTPCSESVAGGQRRVVMSLPGYVKKEERVSVSGDATVEWSLEKNQGILRIVAEPVDVPVWVDGKPVGQGTVELTLRPGAHRVKAGDAACMTPHETEVRVRRGETTTVELKPAQRLAGLNVSTVDDGGNKVRARIYAGETELGQSFENITLPLCTKDLSARHPTLGDVRIDVNLQEKTVQQTEVTFKRQRGPTGIIASGSEDKTIRLWSASDGRHLRTLEGHTGSVTSVIFSPDGQTIASGSLDNTIRLWNANDGRHLRTLKGHTGDVFAVAFSPDGQTIASGSKDYTIRIWNANDGRLLRRLEGHEVFVLSVTFSSDGQTIASGSSGDPRGVANAVHLWDASDGSHLRTLEGHPKSVRSVAFAPDGQTIASGSVDRKIRLWSPSRWFGGGRLSTLTGHTGYVRSVTFSPDGQNIASGSRDNTIRLWNASDGRLLRTLEGHRNSVESVTFSPDGQTIASGSVDRTIRLWNASDGRHLRTLKGHWRGVNSVTFSPR